MRLEVSNAQVEDAGLYSCLATNPAGQDEVEYDLQVYGKYFIFECSEDSWMLLYSMI